MRLAALIVLFAGLANAKVVHLAIQVAQGNQITHYRDQYTVDKNLKIWMFRDRVFGDYKLDKNTYAVVQDTKDGPVVLELDNPLENYGDDNPILLRVVRMRNIPTEQPMEEAKPEIKEEIPMALAMPEIKFDKPPNCKKLAEGVEFCTSLEEVKPEEQAAKPKEEAKPEVKADNIKEESKP